MKNIWLNNDIIVWFVINNIISNNSTMVHLSLTVFDSKLPFNIGLFY